MVLVMAVFVLPPTATVAVSGVMIPAFADAAMTVITIASNINFFIIIPFLERIFGLFHRATLPNNK
jgi:hypothetical protein